MTDLPVTDGNNVPAILVENLTFKYPIAERPALENVSFQINKGEFVGIMGPSGAGKTTLCMILKGLIPYAMPGQISGRVCIDGVEMTHATLLESTKRVGFVFQDPEMQIIGLTVEEDLAFGPENYEWSPSKMWKEIPEILSTVRMSGYQTRETWGLSGGQKQRVAIASALILAPDILILDEPTSELDPIGKAEVFETIHRLKQEKNITVIMVEHEIEELAEMADRIILFNEGTLVDQGTPFELFQKVDLFHQIGGERVPQVAEVLSTLQNLHIATPDQFAVNEDAGVEVLKNILENNRK
jgi:energy-coupling factor transporter ATPase